MVTDYNNIQTSLDAITKSTADLMSRVKTEGVTQGGQVVIPPTKQYNADLSGADGTTAKNNSLLETKQAEYDAKVKTLEKEKEKAETAQTSDKSSWLSFLTGSKSPSDLTGSKSPSEVRTQGLTDLGVDQSKFIAEQKADIAGMEALRKDYDNTVAMRDQQIADIMGRPGIDMNFQDNSIAQINRNANVVLSQKSSAINNKASTMEAKQGYFDNALKLADQAVEDYLWEYNSKYEMYKDFNTQNQEKIDNLRSDLKDALQSAESYSLKVYEDKKTEQKSVRDLMLKYPNSGISIGMTLDEATQKASKWQGTQTNTTGLDSTQESKFWSQINIAKNELQQGEPWGNVWNRIKAQFPSVNNSIIDTSLGGGVDTNKYITDPNNPNASIPNPNYGKGTGWAAGGAFEQFKNKGKSTDTAAWEVDSGIWQWLAGDGENYSDEEKAQQIKLMGRDPSKFGLAG
jgi:hypothetical protein